MRARTPLPCTTQEAHELIESAKKFDEHQWGQIARELASRGYPGRTAMACLRYYRSTAQVLPPPLLLPSSLWGRLPPIHPSLLQTLTRSTRALPPPPPPSLPPSLRTPP